MANTYTVYTETAVACASNKSMFALINLASSGLVAKVYRIGILNVHTAGVTPVSTEVHLSRVTTAQTTTAGITGTAIAPVGHDSTNTSLTNKVSGYTNATTNMSTVANTIMRRVTLAADDLSATVVATDEYWSIPLFGEIFSTGYKSSTLQPIVLRAGEGMEIRQPGSNSVGSFQFHMIFTVE